MGGGVDAPWLDMESLWRMVWLIKKRQRPTGDEWGTESTENDKDHSLRGRTSSALEHGASHI